MTRTYSRGSVPAIAAATGTPVKRALTRLLRLGEAAFTVAAERRTLGALDDRLLKDIGLSRSLAEREAARDFLDVPEHRIRRR
jgi:uncharacterized protein YjiS (DUF1127 family)